MSEEKFAECMERMQNGDKSALKEVYEAYLPYLYSIIMSVLQNKENAEDVTSEFFIKLWKQAAHFKPGGGHKGYLATIARNMAIDFLRKNKREVLMGEMEENGEDTENRGNIVAMSQRVMEEENTHSVETEVISDLSLKEALEKLKPREREIINLKIMGEFTFKEIAEILQLPMGTVTWNYQEGIKKLRRCGYE